MNDSIELPVFDQDASDQLNLANSAIREAIQAGVQEGTKGGGGVSEIANAIAAEFAERLGVDWVPAGESGAEDTASVYLPGWLIDDGVNRGYVAEDDEDDAAWLWRASYDDWPSGPPEIIHLHPVEVTFTVELEGGKPQVTVGTEVSPNYHVSYNK